MVIRISCVEYLNDAINEGISEGLKSLSSDLRKGILRVVGDKGEATALEIQRELGFSLVSVIDACKLLEERHYLEKEERPGRGPKRTKTVYKLTDLGKLAYLVLNWNKLDQVLREVVKLPYMPSINDWLKDKCLREMIQLSICRRIQELRPEEKYSIYRNSFGDVLEFIVSFSFLVLWYSASFAYSALSLSQVQAGEIEDALSTLKKYVFSPLTHMSLSDAVIMKKYFEIAGKTKTTISVIERDFPNLLKLFISIHSQVLMATTKLLDFYEKTERRRSEILKEAYDKAFKDILS